MEFITIYNLSRGSIYNCFEGITSDIFNDIENPLCIKYNSYNILYKITCINDTIKLIAAKSFIDKEKSQISIYTYDNHKFKK
jgi:hypothetical protein